MGDNPASGEGFESEFSITRQRQGSVDFSSPHLDVSQAVVAVKTSPAANVRDLGGGR